MSLIRVLLADDHPLILNGTRDYLNKTGCEVVATAEEGNEALNKIVKHAPDVAILDFDMPKLNGIEIAKHLKYKGIPTQVVLLSLHKQEAILHEVGNSIAGYLTKDTAIDELSKCLQEVNAGHTYVSSRLGQSIHFDAYSPASARLTAAQIKVLKYIEQKYTSAQIAEALFISKRTVEKHRSNIIDRLGLSSDPNALILWLQQNPDYLE